MDSTNVRASGITIGSSGLNFREIRGLNLSDDGYSWTFSGGNLDGVGNIYCNGITASSQITCNGGFALPFYVGVTAGGYNVLGNDGAYDVSLGNGWVLRFRQGMLCGHFQG